MFSKPSAKFRTYSPPNDPSVTAAPPVPLPRYSMPRQIVRWDTPVLLTAKCLLRYRRRVSGWRSPQAVAELREKLPWLGDYFREAKGVDLTDKVLSHRFNTSRKDARRASWPDGDPVASRYWSVAEVLAAVSEPVGREALESLMAEIAGTVPPQASHATGPATEPPSANVDTSDQYRDWAEPQPS